MPIALITGGTSGIARALAARGTDLVLVARDSDRLASVAADLSTEFGVDVETVVADLADRADVGRVAEMVERTDRPIDMLVNNAGFGVHDALTAEDTTLHERALDVMVRAVLILGGAAGRAMRARGSGYIVNTSSTAGFITMGAYSAIKAWVTTYSEGLAVELAGTGVGVTALCPGWVRTEFHERAGIRASSIPSVLWIDADALVAEALRDVARGRVISIPSVRFRLLMWLARHAPRGAIRWVSGRISSSRRH